MIGKLQKKFILISMLSMILVLTVIIGSINTINYHRLVQDAEHILHILAENNGEFPKNHSFPKDAEQNTQNPHTPKTTEEKHQDTPPIPREPKSHAMDMSPEMPYETRYFSVLLTENGTVKSTNIKRIAAIDNETACEYAVKVWNMHRTSGFLSSYRYLRTETSMGSTIIFVDCGRSLSTFFAFLLNSITVSLLGLFSVFLLVLFFSRLVMKPVSESYEKQRQFITDAGHEIKTPLTIIDANREILEMEFGENEWSQSIGRQTSRLTELTNSLIYLSRMEEAKKHLQHTDFSISKLAAETADSFQILADAQGKHFCASIAPSLTYHGDESSICRLFSILLDNAIKYSPPQGSIEVTLDKRGKNIRFMVYNTARQISPESIPHLFDRFYRADSSRNSETGGYGIGLSIARAVTAAHKGKISAESPDGHSLLVTVILYAPILQ